MCSQSGLNGLKGAGQTVQRCLLCPELWYSLAQLPEVDAPHAPVLHETQRCFTHQAA